MRISKLWSAVCAAAFLPGFLSVRAQDNPAQAAARAALMEKMSELNSQPGPPTNQKMAPSVIVAPSAAIQAQPAPPVNKPVAAAVPPPVETKPALAPMPSGTPPAPAGANDSPAQAAARAALMAKMGELNAQQTPPANPGLTPVVLSPSGAAAEQTGPPTKATTSSPPPVVTKPVPAPAPPETPPAPAGANDTPAQAAARAALMAKMSGLNAQQTQTANPVPSSGAVTVTNAGQEQPGEPAKATTVPRRSVTPKPAKPQAAPRVITAPKTTPPPATAAAPVQKTKPVAAPVRSADNSGFTPVPPPSNPGVQAGAQPAAAGTPPLSYQWRFNQQPAPTPPPKATAAPPAKPAAPAVAPAVKPPPPPANASYPGKTLGFPPIGAPPPPVSAQQQADLQALLGKYMANQISPEEYQKERAAILARP
jgi:hypothetical protein